MNTKFLNDKLDRLNFDNPYSKNAEEKSSFLLEFLKELSLFHEEKCQGYQNFLRLFPSAIFDWQSLEHIPPMPVRLFKMHDLYSIEPSSIFKTLTSSGTSGQIVSKIFLDAATAKNQSRILAAITKNFIGKNRIPMVIIDSIDLLKDRTKLNARVAGILGYSIFGRDHFYCLDSDLMVLAHDLRAYLNKYKQ